MKRQKQWQKQVDKIITCLKTCHQIDLDIDDHKDTDNNQDVHYLALNTSFFSFPTLNALFLCHFASASLFFYLFIPAVPFLSLFISDVASLDFFVSHVTPASTFNHSFSFLYFCSFFVSFVNFTRSSDVSY